MDAIHISAANNPADAHIILLPGRGDHAEDYVKNGFTKILQQRYPHIGITAADAHMGYYREQQLDIRLQQDIIQPAQSAGHKKFILCGISLGGLGALIYSKNHPQDISEIWLIAPFLGEDNIIAEINAAGGLMEWQPQNIAENDWQRQLWLWIKQWHIEGQTIPIYLAYGDKDYLHEGHVLLSSILPADKIVHIPGKHQWNTWRQLWPLLLNKVDQHSANLKKH
ncbi:MAG: alpha/beta hydrolase [Gammaproteobacteria bacterium]|nr:alpha/beta hydrolase [Gammaproteobacteria bacterium]